MNPRDIPKWDARKQLWEQQPSTIQFYLNEYDKIKNGINLGGYQMSGWMYFHINFFKTNIINPHTLTKSIMTAPLDDNTYYLMECYKEAVRDGLGFCMWGTRGFAKSTFIGSMKHWTHLTKDGTSMLVYKEGNDLSSIRDMVTTSMSNIHPAFKLNILRGSGDWKDTDVVFGNSLQNNEEFIKSQLRIINADGGAEKASEKGAGLTPIGYVMDEALAFDSILHSREKEITMEGISIGDEIYGDDGELTTVLDKINVGVVPMYEFTLSDGRKVESSADHLWTVYNKSNTLRTLTTQELIDKKTKSNPFYIPLCEPIIREHKDFLVDPYILGYHLGDGDSKGGRFCTKDNEVIEEYSKYYEIVDRGDNLHYYAKKLVVDLRKLGIYGNKHIPDEYLYGSVKQRTDLLAGLLDSDGHVNVATSENGKLFSSTVFTNTNEKIVEGFKQLVYSLGMTCSIHKRQRTRKGNLNKVSYGVTVWSDNTELFKIERKKNLIVPKIFNFKRVSIKEIKAVGEKQAYCIKVDNKSKLFLTTDCIVTHNCGKYNGIPILESAKVSFKYQNKSLFTYILAGTGGNETLSEGAKTMLCNPKDYDLLVMNWDLLNNMVPDEHITWKEDIGRKFGIFVPGQMSYRENEPKLLKTFGEFTKNQFKSEELNNLPINVTDWKATKEAFQHRLDNASDETVKTKQRMYYPMCIDDSFLTSKVNPFNSEAITKKLRELKEHPKYTLVDIEVDHKNDKIETTFQSDKPIAERGYKKNISAPFMIFEGFPTNIPPKYKFVSGADDYKSADATTESLGALYVLQRRTLNMPLERIVACLTERPPTHREMHSKWEKLIRATQAICNLEAADMSFVSYLEDIIKVDAYQYLHPFINPHGDLSTKKKSVTASNYKFGTYPHQWNVKILLETVIQYTQQTFTIGFNPETGLPIVNTGIDLIDDPMLLQEMLDFKFGTGNYDRIFAFGWALLLARHMDSKNIMPEDQHVEKYNRDMFSKPRTKHSNFAKSKAKNF